MDLDSLSLKELKELQSQVARAVASYEERARKQTAAELEEIARARGFTLGELVNATGSRKRSVSVPKYANPDDKSQTWSGRGRKPHWYINAIAKGASPEDLAI